MSHRRFQAVLGVTCFFGGFVLISLIGTLAAPSVARDAGKPDAGDLIFHTGKTYTFGSHAVSFFRPRGAVMRFTENALCLLPADGGSESCFTSFSDGGTEIFERWLTDMHDALEGRPQRRPCP